MDVDYWYVKIQLELLNAIYNYSKTNNLNNKDTCKALGIEEEQLNSLMNFRYNDSIKDFIMLVLKLRYKPIIKFEKLNDNKE